jgi:hypothetical protein
VNVAATFEPRSRIRPALERLWPKTPPTRIETGRPMSMSVCAFAVDALDVRATSAR